MTEQEMQQMIAAQQAQLAQLQGQQGAPQPQMQAPMMPAPVPQPGYPATTPQPQAYYPQPQPQPAYPLPQSGWGAASMAPPPMPCEVSIPIKLKNGDESLTVGVLVQLPNLTPEAVGQAAQVLQSRGFTLAIYKPKGSGGGWGK